MFTVWGFEMFISAGKVFLSVAVFGVVHSLIASRAAKKIASRAWGQRHRNAFYRPFYIAQSFATLWALWRYIRPLPDQVLYRVRGFPMILMRLGQVLGVVYAFYAAASVGLTRISGLKGLLAFLRSEQHIAPEPEAQGPSPGKSILPGTGRMNVIGPFRHHRHPLNFSPLPIFWLNPVMTVKLLAFTLASTIYLILGSVHEETRLEAAYGSPYRRYQNSGIPFFWPGKP